MNSMHFFVSDLMELLLLMIMFPFSSCCPSNPSVFLFSGPADIPFGFLLHAEIVELYYRQISEDIHRAHKQQVLHFCDFLSDKWEIHS